MTQKPPLEVLLNPTDEAIQAIIERAELQGIDMSWETAKSMAIKIAIGTAND